ncbi:hypothetical protein JCM6882_005284 [Rhodosporidiobolus microsporus]
MSEHGSPPPQRKKKRLQGIDTALIVDEPRKRKRREGSVDPAGRGASPPAPNVRARTAEEYEEVRQRGMVLYDKLVAQTDPYDSSRPLWYAFGELPSAEDFPDYYQKIKKPLSLKEVKEKLDRLAYVCLLDVKTDLNQIFVNAKRYNAPKSAVFLDAKKLHKTMKETYAILTGEAAPPEDDDIQVDGPSSSSALPASTAPTSEGDIQVVDAQKKAASILKPWLAKKLEQLMDLTDSEGRSRAGFFLTLPDKHDWPDYYQVIANPLAFDVISSRITKRAYSSVDKFTDDVNTIFANAFQFNEDSSLVCQDAGALRSYFAELMQEPPPLSLPSRKPAAPKRRRGSSAQPEDAYDEEDDDGGSEYGGGSRAASLAPQGYDDAGLYGAGAGGLASASPSLTPAAGSPAFVGGGTGYTPQQGTVGLPSLAAIPEAGALQGLASLAAFAPSAAALNGTAGAARPVASRSVSNEVVHPRLVVKLPAAGEVPLVSGFDLTFHPSPSSSSSSPPSPSAAHLPTTQIRQHSLSIPFSTERVSFTPVFRSSADFLSSSSSSGANGASEKGKGKSLSNGLDAPPTVTVRTKPASLSVSVEAVAVPGSASDATQTAYALTPRKGLSVVEFVVKPANADIAVGEGDGGEEVYRCFVTK